MRKIFLLMIFELVLATPIILWFFLIAIIHIPIYKFTKDETRKRYIMGILKGYDQTGNAYLGDSCDICISTHAYNHYPKFANIIDFFFGKGHCYQSFLNDDDKSII